ncbi:MAG: hypothetical protein KDD84_19515 [Caldilineaceae bacterium]|nr:hypothetical protein [Caldilineaceae bacterium]
MKSPHNLRWMILLLFGVLFGLMFTSTNHTNAQQNTPTPTRTPTRTPPLLPAAAPSATRSVVVVPIPTGVIPDNGPGDEWMPTDPYLTLLFPNSVVELPQVVPEEGVIRQDLGDVTEGRLLTYRINPDTGRMAVVSDVPFASDASGALDVDMRQFLEDAPGGLYLQIPYAVREGDEPGEENVLADAAFFYSIPSRFAIDDASPFRDDGSRVTIDLNLAPNVSSADLLSVWRTRANILPTTENLLFNVVEPYSDIVPIDTDTAQALLLAPRAGINLTFPFLNLPQGSLPAELDSVDLFYKGSWETTISVDAGP